MSTDFSIKPVGSPVSIPVVQPVSAAAVNATPTTLPASQSVTASSGGTATRNDPGPASSSSTSDVAFLDRAAGSVVFQTVNTSTGAVINQFPDDAMLRRRAYFRAQDLAKDVLPNGVATDRNA